MRRRVLCVFLFLTLLFPCSASADGLSFVRAPETVHPGKAEPLTLAAAPGTLADLSVLNAEGAVVSVLRSGVSFADEPLTLTFNGCDAQGQALPEGTYRFLFQSAGESLARDFTVGAPAPRIIEASLSSEKALFGDSVPLRVHVSQPGTLDLLLIPPSGAALPYRSVAVPAGETALSLDTGDAAFFAEEGRYLLSLTLSDGNLSSNSLPLSLTVSPKPVVRPSAATQTIPGDYWSMELGNYDWDSIWQVMIAPMTVIQGSGKEAQKQTYKLRLTPDASSASENIVGEITCETQGVHVLETREDGWTYVEAYNSSYGPNNTSRRGYGETDALIRGYVESARLTVFTPRTDYGLLIDKLTQELYILTAEGLMTTLSVSTGAPTAQQPWNETPAGEFYLSSKVGDFPSGNLICGYGMRFNGGNILHEVPHLWNEKYQVKDYNSTEKYLGEKASHGCVRVQRKQNEDGVNMKWIWDNVPLKTKLLIWDDTGRPLSYPVADDYPLYFNPDGGVYYHADRNCASIKDRFLPLQGVFTYGELDDAEYQRFEPCSSCNPPQRKSEIDALNAANGF